MAYAEHLRIVDSGPAIDPTAAIAADTLIRQGLRADAAGDDNALFELGVAFSTGGQGVVRDLVEAHKWFNLAASRGHEAAQECRAEISDEMTAREIADAQKRARAWLSESRRRAA